MHSVRSIAREASDSDVERSASDALIFGYGPALMGAGAALAIPAVRQGDAGQCQKGTGFPRPHPGPLTGL